MKLLKELTSISGALCEDFSTIGELQEFQKMLGKKFSGIAKVWHVPYTTFYFGFTVVSFLPKHEEKIKKILELVKSQNDIYLFTHSENEKLSSVSPWGHDKKMLEQILRYVNYESWKQKNPDFMFYVLFYGPAEKEASISANRSYYHVSKNPNLEKTGITPQTNLKFKSRIYFWDDIAAAKHFAYNFTILEQDAYIYEITPVGKVFLDKEPNLSTRYPSEHAFYSKEVIPPENVKLVKIERNSL